MAMANPDWQQTAYAAYVTPFAEEIGKALILLVVLRARSFRTPLDGLLFGLAAGTGFAAVENLAYGVYAFGLGGMPAFWETMIPRIPASLVIHGGATALVGAGLAEARWDRRWWVVFAAFPALLAGATFIHGGWNHLVVEAAQTQSVEAALGALALLTFTAFLGYALVAYGTVSERSTMAAELGPEVEGGRIPEGAVKQVTGSVQAVPFAWARRDGRRSRLRRAALSLAFALRREREENGEKSEVARWREEFLAAAG